jgi:hypothetical protein
VTSQPPALLSWLEQRLGPIASLEPLAADASVRDFFRVRREDGASAVAMVDPVGGPSAMRRMIAAAERLGSLGVRVPEILEQDSEAAVLLMEDLGDRLLADELPRRSPGDQAGLYREAGRLAGRIAAAPLPGPDDPLGQPQLGRERLRSELAFFVVHDVFRRRGREDPSTLRTLGRTLDTLVESCCREPLRLAHRDFHGRNLLVLGDDSLGVLDFQDLLPAPAHYDLASLLWDPYVELPPAAVDAACTGYGQALGAAAVDLGTPGLVRVALQRVLKAIGTYARQSLDLGRSRFEASIPPAEARLRDLLARLPDEESGPLREALSAAGLEVGGP